MGPRPDGRGRRRGLCPRPYAPAASMGPRPDGRGRNLATCEPLRITGVNGAAAGWPRKAARLPTLPAPGRRVNGAAAGWPRKGRQRRPPIHRRRSASMGPRPDGRGRLRLASSPRATATVRQWGRGRMAAEVPHSAGWLRFAPRVNGAAAGWPRKGYNRCRGWAGRQASMGPRPDGRGRDARPAAARRDQEGASMGPRPDGRGRPRQPLRRRRPPPASMGPRPDGRGRRAPPPPPSLGGFHASMGPRPDGRGRQPHWAGPATAILASMGPRPDGRGRRLAGGPAPGICRGVNGAAAGWPRKVSRSWPE